MCDPVTLMIMSMAASGAQAVSTISQANKAEKRANAQLQDQYDAEAVNLENQYEEQQRQIVDAQGEDLEAKSDAIRQANEALGTLRATETALSDSSLGTLLFEEAYGNALNYARIDNSGQNKIDAIESGKKTAMQSYLNNTTLAQNQTENVIAEANARKTGAILGFASDGISAYTGYQNQQATIAEIQGQQDILGRTRGLQLTSQGSPS